MQIPVFTTGTTVEVRRKRIARRRASMAHHHGTVPEGRDSGTAALPSVVGFMRTVQADRKDAAIMAQYVRARVREDSRVQTTEES